MSDAASWRSSFDAGLIGLVGLALVDALHLWRVLAVDLPAAPLLVLLAHPFGQPQRAAEDIAQRLTVADLAGDVAFDAAKRSSDLARRLVGALELLGVGVALIGDPRIFADPLIGLAQRHAVPFGEAHEPPARPMHQAMASSCTVVSTITFEK